MRNKIRRIDFLIDREQVEILETFPGTLSEHIRQAIREYIQKIQSGNVSASVSSSIFISKGGEENG